MDASGPIFAVLVVACLFYVIPRQLSWRIPAQEEVDAHLPTSTTKLVHNGIPVGTSPDGMATPEDVKQAAVSTRLMRQAGRRAAWRLARRAEARRRSVFLVLLMVSLATIPFAVMGWSVRWWVPLVAAGVVLAWVVFSRFEARHAQRQLDAIVAETELGDDEKTMAVVLEPVRETHPDAIIGPNGEVQMSLWDPITVAPATYISAPTAARTVRTINLNPSVPKLPVTDQGRRGEGHQIAV